MRLVRHDLSARRNLYLLSWNRDHADDGGAPLDEFLEKWGRKLASEKRNGYYYPGVENGANR